MNRPIPHFSKDRFNIVLGPCAVESKEMFSHTSNAVKSMGATALRGGLFKMRTSPDSYQGAGWSGLEWVRIAKQETALPFICEVTDPRQISDLDQIVDIFQVGTRNMYNYELLKELGKSEKPILLKRGFSARIDEWLLAADYIVREGNSEIILCERGIRTFDSTLRNTLDLGAVAFLKKKTGFPIWVDPSHATGMSEFVSPMALAAVSAGADGLIIEVHPNPIQALSDGRQALTLEDCSILLDKIWKVRAVLWNK